MYSISKSHTGKGWAIYRIEGNVHTPVAYIKETKMAKVKELQRIIDNNFH